MRATCSPTSGPRPAWCVGLLAVQATGWLWLDPLIAIAVAANILREGVSLVLALGRRADGPCAGARGARPDRDQVLAGFGHATIRFDHVARGAPAQRRFVDLHMHMPAELDAGRAAALRTRSSRR
jgi:divalent metal cation (Fe/Co/Zn/Cd) transporter